VTLKLNQKWRFIPNEGGSAMADDKPLPEDNPLKPEDFPVHTKQKKSSRTTVKLSLKRAMRKLQKTLPIA